MLRSETPIKIRMQHIRQGNKGWGLLRGRAPMGEREYEKGMWDEISKIII